MPSTIPGWSVYLNFGPETMSRNYIFEILFAKSFELLNVANSRPVVHRWLGSGIVARVLGNGRVEGIGLVVLHGDFFIKLLHVAQMVQKEIVDARYHV